MSRTSNNADELENRNEQRREEEIVEKKSVHLPPEVWLQVVAWIARAELGEHTSLACRSLSAAARIRMHQKCALFPGNNARRMRNLHIASRLDQQGKQPYEAIIFRTKSNLLEWPESHIPANITGMDKIFICHFDAKVLAFFKHIRPALQNQRRLNIVIKGYAFCSHNRRIICCAPQNALALKHILPLCANAIFSVIIPSSGLIQLYEELPTLYSQCQYLDVRFEWLSDECMAIVLKWLAEPRADGQPKLLKFDRPERIPVIFVEKLKQHFHASTVPCPYVIMIYARVYDITGFHEHNLHSGEQLTLSTIIRDDNRNHVLIMRHAAHNTQSVHERAQTLAELEYDEATLILSCFTIGCLDEFPEEPK